MKKTLLFILLMFVLSIVSYAQVVGDYGSGVTPGTWTTAAHWVVCVTNGTWTGATVASVAPATTTNCFIRNGYTMAVPSSGTINCNNLTVDNGGSLTATASNPKYSPRYLKIYGTSVTVNGSFGAAGSGLSLNFNNATGTTLSGTPIAFYVCRVQPAVATSITFNANVTVTYGGGAYPLTGSSAVYCNGFNTTFTINAGKTVTMDTAAYWSVGTTGSATPGSGANMTNYIYGTLAQYVGANSNINLTNTSGKTSILYVYSTGVVNCGNSMYANVVAGSTVNVTVDAGGQVGFLNSSGVCSIDQATTTMNGTWDFNNVSSNRSLGTASVGGTLRLRDKNLPPSGTGTGSTSYGVNSTIEYYGSTITSLPSAQTSYANLFVNSSVPCTLAVGTTVGNLTFSPTSGNLVLGGFNLNVTGNLTGAAASHYIQTDGTSGLTIPNVGASNVTFPVGTTDYTPAVLNNSGSTDNFTVTVKDGLDNAAVLAGQTLNKQWTITEAGSGANVAVTLQWNTLTDEGPSFLRNGSIVLGRWNGSSWEDKPATSNNLGGNVYSATASGFTSFSPFTVGNLGALPVELSSFTSNVNGRNVTLNWNTKTEKNSDRFVVEKMSGSSWLAVGSVKAAVLSNSTKQYSFTDKNLQVGKYQYRLKMVDNDGSFQYSNIVESIVAAPKDFELSQNYPNPFNPSTKIEYTLPDNGFVKLQVYSVTGQLVKSLVSENQQAGYYTVNFAGNDLSSGIYIYKLSVNNNELVKKMMLLK